MSTALWKPLVRWASTHKRIVLAALLVMENIRVDKAGYGADLPRWLAIFHGLIFLLRKVVTLHVRRLLGLGWSTDRWSIRESVVLATVKFVIRVGQIETSASMLNFATRVQQASDPSIRKHVSFGVGTGAYDCSWITLDPNVPVCGLPTILYIHGGGFMVGDAEMYLFSFRRWLEEFRKQGKEVGILSVQYPLSSEAPYPEPVNFCERVYDHIVYKDRLIDPEQLIIAGDSAGGALAVLVAIRARRLQLEYEKQGRYTHDRDHPCAGLLLISPWVTHKFDTESHIEHSETDIVGGEPVLRKFSDIYRDGHDPFHEEISVSSHPEVHDLPQTLITLGTREVFRDELRNFATRLAHEGVDLTVDECEDMPHVYQLLWPLFSEASDMALVTMTKFATRCLKDGIGEK